MEFWEGWENPKNILVIMAHPDDPEFFCGASIARWSSHGHSVTYCLMTRGEKGTTNPKTRPQDLAALREQEQRAAAQILGVKKVRFLEYADGTLDTDLETRRVLTQVIREEKPDVVVSTDPTNFFPSADYINHPDHRIAGEVTMDAVFPSAYIPHFFPEQIEAGLEPHRVRELWLTLTAQPNTIIDISEYWEQKTRALVEHRSQIGDIDRFLDGIRTWHTPDTTLEEPRYEESFRRFILYKD